MEEGRGKHVRKPAEEERDRKGGRNLGCTWGDRRKLKTLENRVGWTDQRAHEAASTAPIGVCVRCACVSSNSFWTSSSLDVPAGVTQEEGHRGFFIHLPSAVRSLIFLARRIQPFLSLSSTVKSNFVY